MSFIKILRWRIGGALHRFAGRGRTLDDISFQRAAAFLWVLGAEHAGLVLKGFAPEESTRLRVELKDISELDEATAEDVLDEFLQGASIDNLPTYVDRQDSVEVARALVRKDSQSAVDRIRSIWLADEDVEADSADSDDDQDFELEYPDLQPHQKAATFMMWLPPELSSLVFAELKAATQESLSLTLSELPFVTPQARELVLAEFMAGVSLGIPGLALDDVGLPVVVEAFARSEPESVAQKLERKWLSGPRIIDRTRSAVSSQVSRPVEPELSDLEKAAVFFQSLSLPLAYRLLTHLEEAESQSILQAVEDLGVVDPAVRKAVLLELMSKGPVAVGVDAQVLGPALAKMIRRRPAVVVDRIRKR